MPLARILTFDPGEAADFARHLQQLGFVVEITDPNAEQLTLADLEIEFAVCDQQQVLGRASAIAAQLHTEVVVFPGAIPSLPKPISVATESDDFSADLSRNQRFEPREIVEPAQVISTPEAAHLLENQEEPLSQPQSILTQVSERLRNGSERLKVNLASKLALLKSSSSLAGSSLLGSTRNLQENIKQRIVQARTTLQHHLEELQRQRVAAVEKEQQRRAELVVTAQQQKQEELPHLTVPVQPEEAQLAQGEKEKLLAEIEHLRAEASRQAAILEEARLATETLQNQQSSPQSPDKCVTAARRRSTQLRGAVAGAVAACFLFLAGMVLANFRAIIPVSHDLHTGSIEQQVPFGATTIHGASGVTVGGTTVGGRALAPNAASAQQRPSAQAKPQPAKSSTQPAKQKSQWHHFRRRSSRQQDVVADDVTVTHFGPQRKPANPAQQQAQLKRYSDE